MIDLRLLLSADPGEGTLVINCISPDHDDSTASMGVYPDHAWCFGCQSYYGPKAFASFLADQPGLPDYRRAGARQEKEAGYQPMALATTYSSWLWGAFSDRVDWLRARGLRDDTLQHNLIGHSGEAFTIPIIDRVSGELQSIRYRRDDGLQHATDRPKYWGTAGRNSPTLYEPISSTALVVPKLTVLCEGELDALRLAQEGYRAFSMTNGAGAFKAEHAALLDGRAIAIAYDQDDAGQKGAARIAELVPGAKVLRWPAALGKDVTEYLQRWPVAQFHALVWG